MNTKSEFARVGGHPPKELPRLVSFRFTRGAALLGDCADGSVGLDERPTGPWELFKEFLFIHF